LFLEKTFELKNEGIGYSPVFFRQMARHYSFADASNRFLRARNTNNVNLQIMALRTAALSLWFVDNETLGEGEEEDRLRRFEDMLHEASSGVVEHVGDWLQVKKKIQGMFIFFSSEGKTKANYINFLNFFSWLTKKLFDKRIIF